jgi:hypothetical protein
VLRSVPVPLLVGDGVSAIVAVGKGVGDGVGGIVAIGVSATVGDGVGD